jgi:hypothetical protein
MRLRKHITVEQKEELAAGVSLEESVVDIARLGMVRHTGGLDPTEA